MKRIKQFAFLLLCLAAILRVDAQSQKMYVFTQDGQNQSFVISKVRSLTFKDNHLQVNLKSGEVNSVDFDELGKLTFNAFDSAEKDPVLSANFQFYPNPVKDLLYFDYKPQQYREGMLRVQILSLDGKIIYNKNFKKVSSVNSIRVSQLEKGIYIFRLEDGKQIHTSKFIKK